MQCCGSFYFCLRRIKKFSAVQYYSAIGVKKIPQVITAYLKGIFLNYFLIKKKPLFL